MGHWSVYCGISKISITSGSPCVILPLKHSRGLSYREYQPAALPIFGTYNDYGGMANIEKDENTELIEKHFGVSIEEFVEFLVDGKHTYDRSEAKVIGDKIKDVDRIKDMRFMWIDRKVYDFMTMSMDDHDKGYHNLGTPEFMKLAGFKRSRAKVKEGDNYDPKRFNTIYKKGDVSFFSDGKTLLSGKNNYIYHIGKGKRSSLETYIELTEELEEFKYKTKAEMWRRMDPKDFAMDYSFILGDRYEFMSNSLNPLKPKKLYMKYFKDLETFGDRIVGLINVYDNMYVMSTDFTPHTLYITPQDGEHRHHQKLLEKFAEINKSYYEEYEEA